MPLRFATTGWERLEPNVFRNHDDDIAEVQYLVMAPDLPAPLTDEDRLRRATVANTAALGAGVIELDVITVDGLPAIRQIVKVRRPGHEHGVVYIAALTIPRVDRSVVLKFHCPERGVTGMREAVAFAEFHTEYGRNRPFSDILRMWAVHPYAPDVTGGLPRNLSEEPTLDPTYPDHPLTRARRLLSTLAPTIHLNPAFKSAPPWPG
ncbi:hypothetical protein D5S18_15730 [Nocardia panacis]|uniref:Uncharacterized protein n=1 Tax=Nocardia panacis TaxID=2340916 RepID=A0A3A4K3R1_9NOCA|nr:hypothetical protein [Nocardia panacis]RJO74873.1 hypothetical protein D5S18_15730 [Nocardia panacis]